MQDAAVYTTSCSVEFSLGAAVAETAFSFESSHGAAVGYHVRVHESG